MNDREILEQAAKIVHGFGWTGLSSRLQDGIKCLPDDAPVPGDVLVIDTIDRQALYIADLKTELACADSAVAATVVENQRLRAALEVFANRDHWNTTYQASLGPGQVWVWACVTEPWPLDYARKALEAK